LPQGLPAELLPALENLVARYPLEGLWLFGSWARGTASCRSREHAIGLGCGCGRPGSGKTDDKSGGEELPTEWDVGDRHEQQIRPMDVIHLRGVEAGLQEWITPEDEEAFADL
jgi:hypothetical protein